MLKTRIALLAVLTALMGSAFVATPTVRADDETPLAKAMDELGDATKALRKSVRDPAKNAESLELVTKAQQAALTSKMHMPEMLKKAPEAEKAKIIAGYRKMMADTLIQLAKLEMQIIDGKNDEAQETMKALKTLEEEGHEIYNP